MLTHFLFNLYYLGFFSRFLILLCHRHVLFPACHVGWKHTPALFPVQKRNNYEAFHISESVFMIHWVQEIRQKLNVLEWKEHSLLLGNSVIILVVNVYYITFLAAYHSWQQSDCHSLKCPIRHHAFAVALFLPFPFHSCFTYCLVFGVGVIFSVARTQTLRRIVTVLSQWLAWYSLKQCHLFLKYKL